VLFFSCAKSPPVRKPINPSSSSLLRRDFLSLRNTKARPPRIAAPPNPTQTPMIVFRVLFDMPLDPVLSLLLRDATLVDVEVEVLLDNTVEEMVLPPVVMTVTCVET